MFKLILDQYYFAYNSCMSETLNALAKLLSDQYPEVKKETSILVQNFCKKLPKEIGLNAKPILLVLGQNTLHQHSKVRKITVEGIMQ